MNVVVTGICGLINSGDHTQFNSLLRVLREALPKAVIYAVHRNPEEHAEEFPTIKWLEQVGVSRTHNLLLRRAINVGGNLAALVNIAARMRSAHGLNCAQQLTYKTISHADLVVACPGGYLQDTAPAIVPNLVHLYIANRFRRPLFFAPQSVGPFRYSITSRLVSNLMAKSLAVCTREEISLRYVEQELCIEPAKLHLFPDMAFFDNTTDSAAADQVLTSLGIKPGDRFVGTTLMNWWFPGHPKPREALERYCAEVAAAARHLHRKHGLRTLFLRQVGDLPGVIGDRSLLERMRPLVEDAGIFSFDYHRPEVLRALIKQCVFFWGTRMHSNIFAITQGVPVVAISYQHKTRGIMRMCGLEDYVVDIEKIDCNKLMSLFDRVLMENGDIRNKLIHVNSMLQIQRADLVKLLRECIQ